MQTYFIYTETDHIEIWPLKQKAITVSLIAGKPLYNLEQKYRIPRHMYILCGIMQEYQYVGETRTL